MRVFLIFWIALYLGAGVTGCSTASLEVKEPNAITSEKMALLKRDGVTKDEVTEMFGEPEMKTPTSSGTAYFYKDLSLNSLWVIFNEDGTIKKYKWSD